MHVSHQLFLAAHFTRDSVDAHIDDARARLDDVSRYQIRYARRRDKDVSHLGVANHVVTGRVAVTDCRRRVTWQAIKNTKHNEFTIYN